MEAFPFGQNKIFLRPHLTWNQWLCGAFLIFLGCLNLIWPLPTLILLSVLIVLLSFILRPYIALVITIFLIAFDAFGITYYLTKQLYWGYGISYFIAFLGLVCWCPARLAGITPPYRSTSVDLPLSVLYFTAIIGLLWTPYLRDGLHIVFFMTMSYSFYLLLNALNNTPRHLERLFWLFFALGNVTIIVTFATFFFSYFKIFQISDHLYYVMQVTQFIGTRESLKGTMGFPKAIAGLLNISIFCGLTLLCTRERRLSRQLILVSLLAMLFFHFLSGSRLEVIGLFWGWLAFAYLHPRWHFQRIRRHLMVAAAIMIVLLVLVTILSSFYTLNILAARAVGQEQTAGYRFSGFQNRYDHIVHALTRTWETGGFGAGTGGIMRSMDPSTWIDSPSLYFSFLTDHGYGFLSLILAGWIIVNLFMELRWALRHCPDLRHKIFIVGACSNLVMFGSPFGDAFFFNIQMYIVLGLATVAIKGVHYLLESSPDLSLPRFPHQS